MNNDNLNELLKEHFNTRELPESRVREILAECAIARAAYRWRLAALAASSVAAAALVAVSVLWTSTPPPTSPGPPQVAAETQPPVFENHKLLAVMIHSSDCPSSRAMDPVFAKLQEQFINESVLFIKFDYSSDCAKHQAELLSQNLGLEIIFREYKRTGEIILVSSCGKVRDVVDRGQTIASATTVIRDTLKNSTM